MQFVSLVHKILIRKGVRANAIPDMRDRRHQILAGRSQISVQSTPQQTHQEIVSAIPDTITTAAYAQSVQTLIARAVRGATAQVANLASR